MYCYSILSKEGTSFKWQSAKNFTLKTMCNVCVYKTEQYIYIKCETLSLGTFYKNAKSNRYKMKEKNLDVAHSLALQVVR